MKKFRFRIIVILGAVALSIYLLHYTYLDYVDTKHLDEIAASYKNEIVQKDPTINRNKLNNMVESRIDSIRASNPSYLKAREKRIKLGLDLQGGMYLVMEVNTAQLLEKLAKDPDETFKQLLKQSESEAKMTDADIVAVFTKKLQQRGIRLSRYFGSIRDDDDKIISKLKEQSDDAVRRAEEIIRNRVDQYGVSEPSITRQGSRRIIIQLPGVAKEEEARQLLQGSALLEFKLVKDPEFTISVMQKIDEALAGAGNSDSLAADTTKKSKSKKELASKTSEETKDTTNEQLSQEEFAKKHPFFSIALINPQSKSADAYVKEENREKLDMMLNSPAVKKVMPNNVEFLYSAKPVVAQDGSKMYTLYMVNKTPELTGGVITDAQANIDPQTSAPIVTMQMNSEGAREWARITGSNIGKRIAIVLDNAVYSAPVVQNKIPSGNSQISGMPNMDEAKLIEIVLKAGALPAPVNIIEERTVGPSLGEDSISKGFTSAIIGFSMVGLFMLIIYARVGVIADVALFFAILFIFGFLAGFNATLTLPGIAGIVLTMGMAVDANVLIYERIREELTVGKTMKAAIDSGFKFSFATVIDSHVTTLITGIILYQFGTGPVQGFALTLIIGIFTSLFGALVISRVILDFMVEKGYKITLG
jgi:SecD/SecF fusion protein